MNCRITVTPDFLKEMKYLFKRYKSLKEDLNKWEKNWNVILSSVSNWGITCAKCVWLSLRKEKANGVGHGLSPTRSLSLRGGLK